MPYAIDRPYCGADSHIMETRDWIANFTDPDILARLPEMSLLKSGTKSFGTDDPIGRFERTFKGISEDAKAKFYCDTFRP
jgi:hypothetical protein